MRSVLITGCSSGIGLDAARGLRARGWRVLATCRKEEDCARLRAEGFESFVLDQADGESVAAGASEALARTGGALDAVFNNGAFAVPGAVEDIPRDAMRAIFETNLIGVHDLTRRLIPAMRARGAGRIVMCSSMLGFVGIPWRGAYVATKFALEGLSEKLRLELRGSGIAVVLIEPGPVTSRIRQNAIANFERWVDWKASALAPLYRATLLRRLYEDRGPDRFELPASAVTAALIRALEDPRPRLRYRVTLPARAFAILRRLLPGRMLDRILSRG